MGKEIPRKKRSYGIFQNKEDYHAFMGGLKSLDDPEIKAMIPVLNDIVLGKPIGHTASKYGLRSGGMIDLLADKRVRAELDIVDFQYDELKRINRAVQERIAKQLRSLDLNHPKDYASTVREITRSVQDRHKGVLLPHQLDRLRQLSVQNQIRRRSIADVLTTDPLATKLKITDQQKQALKQAEREIEEELARQIEALRKQSRNKLLSHLTQTQRNKLEKIIGDDFQFSQPKKPGKFKKRKAKKPLSMRP